MEIVSTFLHRLETDPDSAVRKAGAELLLSIVPYSRHHKYLLEIIYRVSYTYFYCTNSKSMKWLTGRHQLVFI